MNTARNSGGEAIYLTHYFYPGTDPWKNIMLLPEDEAFRIAGKLAAAHPETTSFGRFADFRNYYPARKKADEYVRGKFAALGGKPVLAHPYSFTLMECEYLRKWFSNGEKIVISLEDVPDDQISFTIGDSCALFTQGLELVVLTKKMLLEQVRACDGLVDVFLKKALGRYQYVEVQLWDRV
jgi:hypothetical protein